VRYRPEIRVTANLLFAAQHPGGFETFGPCLDNILILHLKQVPVALIGGPGATLPRAVVDRAKP